MKYLIAGLGNIGPEYELTRHNIGFLVLDQLAEKHGTSFQPNRYADVASFTLKSRSVTLIKPTTYMNLSGKAIRYWIQQLNITNESLMVITDDVALPFGKLRMRSKGSSAGHNGLKNIEQLLNTQDYPRLKFGIGNDYPKGGQVDYVLGRFNKEEFDALPELMQKAGDMIEAFIFLGIERAMNFHN